MFNWCGDCFKSLKGKLTQIINVQPVWDDYFRSLKGKLTQIINVQLVWWLFQKPKGEITQIINADLWGKVAWMLK
jgi:hypothetical protein